MSFTGSGAAVTLGPPLVALYREVRGVALLEDYITGGGLWASNSLSLLRAYG